MEIVCAILILIGAVVAGSTSSTSQEVHTEKYPAGDSEQTTVAQSIKAMRGRLPDGRLIQRDLTAPHVSTAVMSKVNPEEAGHGCDDR